MLHLTCETRFLLLFVFLISLLHYHHPALLHHHALILDRLLTFLMAFSTLILKPSFSRSLIAWDLTTRYLAVAVVVLHIKSVQLAFERTII